MCKSAGGRTSPQKEEIWKVRTLHDVRNSVVGIASPYGMNGPGFELHCGQNVPKFPDRDRGPI